MNQIQFPMDLIIMMMNFCSTDYLHIIQNRQGQLGYIGRWHSIHFCCDLV